MKKILFTILCCICLCGCGSKYQVSELEPTLSADLPHVRGNIKKISDDSCNEIKVIFEYKNGSIKDEGYIILKNLEKDKIVSFNEWTVGVSNVGTKWLDYKLKFKKIECWPY